MSSSDYSGANAEAVEAWDTVLFDKFVRFRPIVVGGLGPHGSAAMDRLGAIDGMRVLDLGCGFGDTTQDLVRRGAREAVGVDAAPRFIALARQEAGEGAKASFAVRDVQVDDLGGPFDAAFSRMGVMFFASPVQAFRNVRAALRDGGRLAMAVWRKREDNPWVYTAETIVKKLVPHPEKTDQVTCGPGPFSMNGPDLVSDQLLKAGFTRPSFERLDLDLLIGRTLDEAIELALALGPAGEIIRLAGDEGQKRKPEVVAALRDAFAPLVKEGGVYGGSSTWIITAQR